jgi:hypothetical protein
MLKRLGIDLYNLVEAYREKMPARDIEALAEDVVSRLRALPAGTKLEFALFFKTMIPWPPRQTDGLSLNLDRVCEAVNRIQIDKATPVDFEAIKATAGLFIQADETSMPIESPAPMSLYDSGRKAPEAELTAAGFADAARMTPADVSKMQKNDKTIRLTASLANQKRAGKDGRRKKGESVTEIQKKLDEHEPRRRQQ